MTALYASLSALGAALVLIYLTVLWRTWCWKRDETGRKVPALKGFALPVGSIRGLIALLLVGGFVIFIFFGRQALEVAVEGTGATLADRQDAARAEAKDLYIAVLTTFGTLTGAVTGFYFGGRGSQSPPERKEEPDEELKAAAKAEARDEVKSELAALGEAMKKEEEKAADG